MANGSAQPRTWAIVVWGLYLASFVTSGLAGIIGLIIAYLKRDELAGTPFASHMTSAIRTFWISLIAVIVGGALAFIGIGVVILFAAVLWLGFRCIRGLVRAIDGQPIADPEGWL